PNRDGWRDSRDFVNVRLLDALQKLPRIGRKRLDIPALALGIERVKRQAGLSRTRNSGNHRDGIMRNREIEILQIVDPSATYADLLDVARNRGTDRGDLRFGAPECLCEWHLVCRVLWHACK